MKKLKLILRLSGFEEGEIFKFKDGTGTRYKIENGKLLCESGLEWLESAYSLNDAITNGILDIEPTISLAETQRKRIEGKGFDGYEWLARNEFGKAFIYTTRELLEKDVSDFLGEE